MIDIPTWLFPVIAFVLAEVIGRAGTLLRDYIEHHQ